MRYFRVVKTDTDSVGVVADGLDEAIKTVGIDNIASIVSCGKIDFWPESTILVGKESLQNKKSDKSTPWNGASPRVFTIVDSVGLKGYGVVFTGWYNTIMIRWENGIRQTAPSWDYVDGGVEFLY